MIKVKIQTDNNRKFTIPLPYSMLRVCASILSSKFVWRLAIKGGYHQMDKSPFLIAPPDPKLIKPLLASVIQELQQRKNLILVDIKLQDGTQVMIKL
ncbi:hypothetical protein PP175_04270 [Aneurinibacillus sp. Ricciae_BoGa-3]|uniref:hypothetical protein n=1 Tax=Aneurinibacillus sp. Ricciae_BoGa-3 TaxID=3022697 RepID=UPI0023420BB4|nr:hypothetical protein [Aneurinibacillus sp. Ricciae_BoGa-3]WCK55210.1 hypothetical protein PP175_04270 [Aneurinibacillus sp. Ricciae_BoGa-3]